MYPLPLFEIRHQIFYLALLTREPDSYIQKDRRRQNYLNISSSIYRRPSRIHNVYYITAYTIRLNVSFLLAL